MNNYCNLKQHIVLRGDLVSKNLITNFSAYTKNAARTINKVTSLHFLCVMYKYVQGKSIMSYQLWNRQLKQQLLLNRKCM